MRYTFAALLLAMLPTMATPQFFFRERLIVPVVPLSATEFEVIDAEFGGPGLIWCAAGIYAARVLNQRRSDLWVERPYGPSQAAPGRNAVAFTVVPIENDRSSWSFIIRERGYRKSSGSARAACDFSERLVYIRVNGRLITM